MDSVQLQQRAQEIAAQYQRSLPEDYVGRYSALADAQVLETLFRAVGAGLNMRSACEAAGITQRTIQYWQHRADADPDSAFSAFFADLKAARARGQLSHLENIKKHSAKEWTASAWTLERTDPEQFGKRDSDSSQPKVVVQIGVTNSDVQVSLSPASTPLLGEGQRNP